MKENKIIKKNYPKVLIVCVQPINKTYATGITMGNLFRNWPSECLAQIYLDDSIPDNKVCSNSWKLNLNDLNIPEIIYRKIKFVKEHNRINKNLKKQPNINVKKNKLTEIIIYYIKKIILLFLNFSSYKITNDLDQWIIRYNPDLIYSTLESNKIIKLVYKIKYKYKISVVPHFMDDWLNTHYSIMSFDRIFHFQRKIITKYIIHSSKIIFVIGESMAVYYKEKYNKIVLPFMNCVELSMYKSKINNNKSNNLKLIYAGAVNFNRWKSLIEIGNALLQLKKENINCIVEIYGDIQNNNIYNKITEIQTLKYLGNVSQETILEKINIADGLIFVESFEKENISYTKYSLSTKIPEYLSVGGAIFAYGPAEIASIKYIEENKCGVVVNIKEQYQLISKLRNFIVNPDLRIQISQNSRKLAEENHSAVIQRELFRLALHKVSR